jgi:hypothetical protein
LFGAGDLLRVALGDLRTNGFGGAFDGFGRDVQTRQRITTLGFMCHKKRKLANRHFHVAHSDKRRQEFDEFIVQHVLEYEGKREIGRERRHRTRHESRERTEQKRIWIASKTNLSR